MALLNFFQTRLSMDEGQPIDHPLKTFAMLLKADANVGAPSRLSTSYNFNHSRKENETFDVASYGASANGTEGDPARINVMNTNFFTTFASNKLNEFHFTYSRESRPRTANESNLAADTGIGFAPSFRFGNPFFMQPNVDELIWRTQLKNNLSIVRGGHTWKMGGEWMHTLNDQVFRGFFTGRYLFESVEGFLRYTSPAAAGGFGPRTMACTGGVYVTLPAVVPGRNDADGGPLFFYLQGAGRTGLATDETGASRIANEEFSLFIQDQWQVRSNVTLQYGLRWDAQFMPETADPATTAFAPFLNNPRFPSDGTIPDQVAMWQPRAGATWDVRGNGRSVVRASAGIYFARQNMLSQVGSVTTNGLQQQTLFVSTDNVRLFGATPPIWPGVLTPTPVAEGQFPLFSGVRVFHRDYENPRTTTANVGYEQEVATDVAAYADYTYARGRHLTRFINYNRADAGSPFSPQLDETMVTTSLGQVRLSRPDARRAEALLEGLPARGELRGGARQRRRLQRARSVYRSRVQLQRPVARLLVLGSRHPAQVQFLRLFRSCRGDIQLNARVQARGAQPITPNPRVLNGVDQGRNTLRKDNEYFSFDWRVSRPFRLGGNMLLIPTIEMFNTFNNANNINPLSTPALFNFDGFLRTGVGDPRQVQLAVKLTLKIVHRRSSIVWSVDGRWTMDDGRWTMDDRRVVCVIVPLSGIFVVRRVIYGCESSGDAGLLCALSARAGSRSCTRPATAAALRRAGGCGARAGGCPCARQPGASRGWPRGR